MNLNDHSQFEKIDAEDMLAEIDHLPEQLGNAWNLGLSLTLPHMGEIHSIVAAGMGGSAIAADLFAAAYSDVCPAPVFVQRDYDLPAWAMGRGTLVILSSHSGNTEETLSVFDQAVQAHCQIITLSTGGKLTIKANSGGFPAWTFTHKGQPRAAVGFSFGLLLALITRLGLIPDPEVEVAAAVKSMAEQRLSINAESPLKNNSAKRLGGQFVGRAVTFFGAGHMVPVARRWKSQINEVAKSLAAYEPLPECDHNALAGIYSPQSVLEKSMAIFIRSESDHPRNVLRFDLTQRFMLEEGINTDGYLATGKSRLEQLWRAVQFGDYVSYYLAMATDTNPSAVPMITELKNAMAG
jgi:glucose/mannose-6-phosphate isomerase